MPRGCSPGRDFHSLRRPSTSSCSPACLGTTQYGLLAGAVAMVAVVSQYSSLGSGLLFLRYVSPDHSRFRLYWGNILLSVFLLGALLVLGLRLSGRWLVGAASVPLLFPIGSATVSFSSSAFAPDRSFRHLKR